MFWGKQRSTSSPLRLCCSAVSVCVLNFATSPNSGVKCFWGFLRSEKSILRFIFSGCASFSRFLYFLLLRSRGSRNRSLAETQTHFTQCQHLKPPLQLPPCPQNTFHPVPTPQTPFSPAPMPSKHISPSANTSNPLFTCPHSLKTHFTKCQHVKPPLQLPPCPQNTFHPVPAPQNPFSPAPMP